MTALPTPLLLAVLLAPPRPQAHPEHAHEVLPVEIGTSAAASVDEVWECWTTEEGLVSFLAPAAFVELRVGGPWEFGADEATAGSDGSGVRILDHVTGERLSVEWPVPERFPETRGTPTRVDVVLRRMSDQRTLVTIEHTGFGEGHEWAHVSEYFQLFWSGVLNNLRRRFERGPVPWAEQGVDVAQARARVDERRAAWLEAPPRHWVIRLEPRDAGVATDPSPEDAARIQEHFERLRRMLDEGSLLLAGPAREEPWFGLVVFEARDRSAAQAVLRGDPAVRAGVMTGALQAFHVSLARE